MNKLTSTQTFKDIKLKAGANAPAFIFYIKMMFFFDIYYERKNIMIYKLNGTYIKTAEVVSAESILTDNSFSEKPVFDTNFSEIDAIFSSENTNSLPNKAFQFLKDKIQKFIQWCKKIFLWIKQKILNLFKKIKDFFTKNKTKQITKITVSKTNQSDPAPDLKSEENDRIKPESNLFVKFDYAIATSSGVVNKNFKIDIKEIKSFDAFSNSTGFVPEFQSVEIFESQCEYIAKTIATVTEKIKVLRILEDAYRFDQMTIDETNDFVKLIQNAVKEGIVKAKEFKNKFFSKYSSDDQLIQLLQNSCDKYRNITENAFKYADAAVYHLSNYSNYVSYWIIPKLEKLGEVIEKDPEKAKLGATLMNNLQMFIRLSQTQYDLVTNYSSAMCKLYVEVVNFFNLNESKDALQNTSSSQYNISRYRDSIGLSFKAELNKNAVKDFDKLIYDIAQVIPEIKSRRSKSHITLDKEQLAKDHETYKRIFSEIAYKDGKLKAILGKYNDSFTIYDFNIGYTENQSLSISGKLIIDNRHKITNVPNVLYHTCGSDKPISELMPGVLNGDGDVITYNKNSTRVYASTEPVFKDGTPLKYAFVTGYYISEMRKTFSGSIAMAESRLKSLKLSGGDIYHILIGDLAIVEIPKSSYDGKNIYVDAEHSSFGGHSICVYIECEDHSALKTSTVHRSSEFIPYSETKRKYKEAYDEYIKNGGKNEYPEVGKVFGEF